MSTQKTQKLCKHCKEKVMAERPGPNHILHLLLSVITAGVWLPIWLLSSVSFGGWRCCRCGSKV